VIRSTALTLTLFLLSAAAAIAANYIEPQELRVLLDRMDELVIVDIQPAADYELHHLPGSIETRAFPAVRVEEKSRLDMALPAINAAKGPVVIVCPRGKSGALNSYRYLASKGVSEDRLRILEDGIAEWPYRQLLEQGR